MKKFLLLFLSCSVFAVMQAQSFKEYKEGISDYNPELGYFQKAHTDLGDPRFMFTDNTGNFTFGVGATVHLTGYFDFLGSIDDYTFKPCMIHVPTYTTNHLGLTMSNTEFHIKAKSYLGKHKLIAYVQVNNKAKEWSNNEIRLQQAYISWNNFSVGRTYSFFMDLEAGPMTVDMQGPNAQVGRTHCLVGYTLPINDKWTFAVAAEEPSFNVLNTQQYGVGTDFQPAPDVAMHIKYKGKIGHVQLGGLARCLAYYSTIYNGVTFESGQGLENVKTFYDPGFGVSLSGKINATSWLSLSAQITGGTGISAYINDLDDMNINFGLINPTLGQYLKMNAVPSEGGYASAEIRWNEELRSSLIYGFTHVNKPTNMILYENLKSSQYFAANLFWYYSQYFFIGVEYLHGYKTIYAAEGELDHAHANRIDATVTYRF